MVSTRNDPLEKRERGKGMEWLRKLTLSHRDLEEEQMDEFVSGENGEIIE
jgi:hypothetical protein